MNKGAIVRRTHSVHWSEMTACERVCTKGFTAGNIYRVKAGRGDSTVGLNGNLCGAFIINDTQMVLTDDFGRNRQTSFDKRFWELVEDCENINPVHKEASVYKPIVRKVLNEITFS